MLPFLVMLQLNPVKSIERRFRRASNTWQCLVFGEVEVRLQDGPDVHDGIWQAANSPILFGQLIHWRPWPEQVDNLSPQKFS